MKARDPLHPELTVLRHDGAAPASESEAPWTAHEPAQPISLARRRFLQVMGTALAIPSLEACTRQPAEKIVPYVKPPEQMVPGRPLFYATATTLGGVASGALVETHMGRPTKVEGNPEHPRSLGGSHVFAQAEILQLYDPDRSQTVLHQGQIATWGAFVAAMQRMLIDQRSKYGSGLRIVTGELTSPTLIAQLEELLAELPLARWYVHEPIDNDAAMAGSRMAFGEALGADYHPDVSTVLSLDADFLAPPEGDPITIRLFADARALAAGAPRHGADSSPGPSVEPTGSAGDVTPPPRLYVIESQMSTTGAKADHRIALRAAEVEHAARFIAAEILPSDQKAAVLAGATRPPALSDGLLRAIVDDLKAGRSVVIPGRFQPPVVHALAHAMNAALEESAVSYHPPVFASAHPKALPLGDLARDLDTDKVELLVLIGANPVYDAAADLRIPELIGKAKLRVHLGAYFDETAAECHWHIPEAHAFEAWTDARSIDGTATVLQPLIEPLFASKSAHELLAAMSSRPDRSGHDILRQHWRERLRARIGVAPADAEPEAAVGPEPPGAPTPAEDPLPPARFEELWRLVLHHGSDRQPLPELAPPAPAPPPRLSPISWPAAGKPAAGDAIEVVFRPDAAVYDGRYANNAWLQELPRPITKLTWDNAVLIAPATAAALGLADEDQVEIESGGRRVTGPILVVPGQAPGSVTVHLGYGRARMGRVSAGAGFDVFRLRAQAARWHALATLRKTGDSYPLALAQTHPRMEGRDLVRSAKLSDYLADPKLFSHHEHKHLSLYPPHEYKGYAWGMTVDLTKCVGCSACVVACQAENNIPVVGKAEVQNHREMHWLRIDRYFEGDDANPTTHFQPIPCMQCENAPCEVVCPVNATAHHDEGLNDMVYNRCVGTRYCSDNCPYKVRRFNWFPYAVEPIAPLDPRQPTVQMAHNPDVSVRTRGVMEKCTYCVQRINVARVEAKKEERRIRDGDIMTACQAACPARAIVFGDTNDKKSAVVASKGEGRNYAMLAELNTSPRTTYLAKLVNPRTELAPTEPEKGEGH
jgi:molybdopterin-containing oxidoreductase family iron-sulfur binding subunit